MAPKPNAIVFCDIDGCLNDGKHIPLDLGALATIRNQISRLAARGVTVSLCTGRPQPYAEAMAQVLDLQTPMICEYGAMVFDPVTDAATPLLTAADQDQMNRLRQHLKQLTGRGNKHVLEHGKEVALSITGPGIVGASNAAIQAQMETYQAQSGDFDVTWTYSISAIDIAPKGISKQTGAAYLLDRYGIDQNASYAIGDSKGDIPVLSFVNRALCPANAANEVKQICDHVAGAKTAEGTIELLNGVLDMA